MRAGVLISLAAGILILAQVGNALSEPNGPDQFLILQDYLTYAEAHNAGLKSIYQQWQMTLEQVPQAKALPDPQVTYNYWTKQSDLQTKQTLGVMQVFPWFGKIDARTEASIKEASAAQQKYQAARLALFKEVKEGFYEFAYLARATDIAIENLELFKHFEEVARTRHMTSETGHPDVIRAQVEIAKMEDVLRGLNQLREPTLSRLRTALTLPAEMNLPWPRSEEYNSVELDYEQLVSLLRQKNPELAGLNFEAMAAKSKIDLAEKNFYPDVGIGVNWENMDSRNGRDGVAMVFQMNLPLWRDNYRGAVRQAQAQKESVEQQKVDTENILLTKASQAYYEYRDSVRKIRLYRDTLIPKVKELLQASEAAYRSGSIDFLSLIDAQRMLLDYHLSYQRALANNQQKLADLEMLTGTELESRTSTHQFDSAQSNSSKSTEPVYKGSKISVILDTDICDDIDDTWALAMLLQSPEFDIKLITTAVGDTEAKTKVVARILQTAGRTDIPVGTGIAGDMKKGHRQDEWVKNFDLSKYPGKIYPDGVQAMVDTIMRSPGPITLIAIGPLPNVSAALQREPKIAEKVRFVGMHGSVRRGYGGKSQPQQEYNIASFVKEAQRVFTAGWDMTITPLDTCSLVMLRTDKYKKVLDSANPMAKTVIENYRVWAKSGDMNESDVNVKSTTLFDTVAIYLAMRSDLLEMEKLGIRVTDDGRTVIDEKAKKINCATQWKDINAFEDFLVERLTGPIITINAIEQK